MGLRDYKPKQGKIMTERYDGESRCKLKMKFT